VRSAEGQELAALVIDLGYKFAEHPKDLTRDQINFLMAARAFRAEQAEQARLAEEGITRIVVKEE
jgi:hypothetical protein